MCTCVCKLVCTVFQLGALLHNEMCHNYSKAPVYKRQFSKHVRMYFLHRVVAMLIKISREAIKCRDERNDMALHLACRKGHLKVVKEIMEWEPTTIGPKYV